MIFKFLLTIFTLIVFISTAGSYFKTKFGNSKVLMGIAIGIAIISTYFTIDSIINGLKAEIIQEISNKENNISFEICKESSFLNYLKSDTIMLLFFIFMAVAIPFLIIFFQNQYTLIDRVNNKIEYIQELIFRKLDNANLLITKIFYQTVWIIWVIILMNLILWSSFIYLSLLMGILIGLE